MASEPEGEMGIMNKLSADPKDYANKRDFVNKHMAVPFIEWDNGVFESVKAYVNSVGFSGGATSDALEIEFERRSGE